MGMEWTFLPGVAAATVAASLVATLIIGFAAETHDVEALAIAKLKRKRCDWIVSNDVSGDVMGGAMNQVSLVTRQGIEDRWPRMTKEDVAVRLVARIADEFGDAADQIAAQ